MPTKIKGAANGKMSFDPDDPDYVKDLQRPAVIKEDLNEMERRKRVNEILANPFRGELEKLVEKERAAGNNEKADKLASFDILADAVISPRGQLAAAQLQASNLVNARPIADLGGTELVSKPEQIARNRLACLYRLVDLFQWSTSLHNHISMRSPDDDAILVNPLGILYHEISASNLVKVSLNNEEETSDVHQATLQLHKVLHRRRPDLRCVIHLQNPVIGAISAMKCGLLPLCQEAVALGGISYYDLQSNLDSSTEIDNICTALGQENQRVLFMRPVGALVAATTSAETFLLVYNLLVACETQVRAARAGIDNLILPNIDALKQQTHKSPQKTPKSTPRKAGDIEWRTGELEWEAWMRQLDNAGLRTGHFYRCASLRPVRDAIGGSQVLMSTSRNSDVETPPCVSGVGELPESDVTRAHRLLMMKREQERVRWLTSPNAYQKIEFLEKGTDNPKKITKWVPGEATIPTNATPTLANGTQIKIQGAHQFSPLSKNPKEFKEKQRQIKEARFQGTISGGPQSHVLDGVTAEDIARINEQASQLDGRIINIGTASKGIIERQYRHHAQVYKSLYAPNPFASETDEDIEKYLAEVRAKSQSAEPKLLDQSDQYVSATVKLPWEGSIDDGGDEQMAFHRSKSTRVTCKEKALAHVKGSTSTSMIERDVASDTEIKVENRKKKKKLRAFFRFGRKKEEKDH